MLEPQITKQVWHVYIVECANDTLYTGITNNLQKRISAHNSGKGAKYTKSRSPVTLVYKEEYPNKSEARKREMQIQDLSRQEKLDLYN